MIRESECLMSHESEIGVSVRGYAPCGRKALKIMKPKLIVALLVITAVPVCAQAQEPNAVTNADVQKVVKIISGNKAKTKTYCDMAKLGNQIAEADEKKADELNQKMDELRKKLGPEYVALMDAFQDIDPDSEVGQEIDTMLDALDKSCAK